MRDYQSNVYINFHIIMVLASIYLTVMMTNWGTPIMDSRKLSEYMPSDTSKWIKISCAYVASALYIWTLVAPRIFLGPCVCFDLHR